ncbi:MULTISPECIES: hypothetical protein [Streptomyces]|uniref:Uncharacterized protein n=1 Tax=Streptomyces antibioticus TaxID=1890 RepID=A0AAE6Y8I5_STRAT|nr:MULTISPECIES: hypothetical protein [Streptomyces]NUV61896.1 hypothetical protein [Streptomyces sp. CAI-85]OOQ53162.1 hypothetical protein AFM16_12585 [Streptomyces antibioticus]QIT44327.1 hypothetical protein HCX60_12770 [Streptomyces antibioticus]
MAMLALIGVLALVIAGCACVWWTSRADDAPRWARAVSAATLALADLLSTPSRRSRRGGSDDD